MPDEPDRYDLDEMMDRLKQRPGEASHHEGELVTREDGSQAIKVRRRKRRTKQPHKERQRRFRMFQVTAALVVGLIIMLAIGFVTVFVNTAPYRKSVADKLSVTSGAEVELQQFRMNPTGVNVHGVDLEWPDGNILDSMSIRVVSADVWPAAVLTGRLSGQELTAQSTKLVLQHAVADQPRRVVEKAKGQAPVHFSQCAIKTFEVEMNGRQPRILRLTGSEATYMPADEGKASLLRIMGGDLRARGWPLLRLDRAYIEFTDQEADVVGLSLMHADEDRGRLELSGILSPYKTEEPSRLAVEAKGFLFSGVLGDALGEIFHGWVDTSPDAGACELRVQFGEQPDVSLSMAYQASKEEPFAIQNLPFLYALSQTLEEKWFSRPDFWDVVSGRLVRHGDKLELSEIEFSRKDYMAVRGQLTQEAGRLSGSLEVGISFAMIQASENAALDAMFSKPREGFRWIPIEISGTASDPKDDFAKRYEQALAGLKSQPREIPGKTGGSSFEELTRPR